MRRRALPVRRRARAAAPTTPTFRALTADECTAMLSRNTVGRLAFSRHDRVEIEPVHYVLDDGWLYGRTSVGSKVAVLAHHPWVAFEIDEVQGAFDWASVVVHGTVYRFQPTRARAERLGYDRAVAALRHVVPATLSDADPVPFRRVVFGIHIDQMTGRAATP